MDGQDWIWIPTFLVGALLVHLVSVVGTPQAIASAKRVSFQHFLEHSKPGDVILLKSWTVMGMIASFCQGFFSHTSVVVEDRYGEKALLDSVPFQDTTVYSYPFDPRVWIDRPDTQVYWLRCKAKAKPAREVVETLRGAEWCFLKSVFNWNGVICSEAVSKYLVAASILPKDLDVSVVTPSDLYVKHKDKFWDPIEIQCGS